MKRKILSLFFSLFIVLTPETVNASDAQNPMDAFEVVVYKHTYMVDIFWTAYRFFSGASLEGDFLRHFRDTILNKFPQDLTSAEIKTLQRMLGMFLQVPTPPEALIAIVPNIMNVISLLKLEEGLSAYKDHMAHLSYVQKRVQGNSGTIGTTISLSEVCGWREREAEAWHCFDHIDLEPAKKPFFQRALHMCVGKIFIVVTALGKKSVRFSGSGMIVPPDRDSGKPFFIITCKHNFKKLAPLPSAPLASAEQYQFFFLPANNMNLDTGWKDEFESEKDFIDFLSRSETVIPILDTKLLDLTGAIISPEELLDNKDFNDCIVKFELSDAQIPPKLKSAHDELQIASVNLYAPGDLRRYQPNCYFAIGYPVTPYLQKVDRSRKWQETQYSPFTIMSSRRNPEMNFESRGGGGLPRHRLDIPTAPGMSGGPVLYFDKVSNRIIILGIVAEGQLGFDWFLPINVR